MSKYYCLIAGLPNIALDDSKLAYTVSGFREELEGILTSKDKRLIDLFFLKFDNANLIQVLRNADAEPDERGMIAVGDYRAALRALRNEEAIPKIVAKRLPAYVVDFMKLYLQSEEKGEAGGVSWSDRLAALYYAYAMRCGNQFVADWFELNLNMNNMLTAITCRKHGWDKADYIVGTNEVANALRTSNARDFGLGDTVEYLPDLQRIAEETDLMAREKKIDLLKWEWLEENTFFKTFDIESVFAYMLKLEMIERWVTLDKTTGEKTFREIVGAMKKGSENALDEFKRNNER